MDSLIDENILVQPITPNMIGTAVQNMFSFLQEEEEKWVLNYKAWEANRDIPLLEDVDSCG